MTQTPVQIAQKMFTETVRKPKRSSSTALAHFFEAGGSVAVLAHKGIDGLIHDYALNRQEASEFQQRLNVLSTVVLRHFIEHQLTGKDAKDVARGGLDNGPTYSLLFKPNFEALCVPGAIEAIHSPVAYLTALFHWALHRLGVTNGGFPLSDRRTDLGTLKIDVNAVHGVVSSVEVISNIMENFITDTLGTIQDLDKALSEQAFPRALPFHWPWVTLDQVMNGHGESVGNMVRLCDLQYPYFLRSAPWSAKSDAALIQASRLSPSQRILVTESAYFPGGAAVFYPKYFGLQPQHGVDLANVSLFNERAKLDTASLEALLSLEGFSTSLSANAPGYGDVDTLVNGKDFGSVFIHEAKDPPITIRNSDTGDFLNRFVDMTDDRFDRVNRILRLNDWLGLEHHETDQLIVAAMLAEHPSPAPTRYWITPNTLRALGLFQQLREGYGCTAEECAVFIAQISVFGRGTERSQYDRIFNGTSFNMRPLVLDDRAVPIIPVTGEDLLTVNQLCAGLGIDLQAYFYIANLVAAAHGLTHLKLSLPIVSSFYRLARLPRLLGITSIEAILLLNLMGGQAWVDALAGVPQINSQQLVDTPDVLSVIHALMDCVQWAYTAQLPVDWVVQQATAWPPAQPDARQLTLFDQWRRQAPAVLMTEDMLKLAGAAPLSNNRQWLRALVALVDEDGLIRDFVESADKNYEAHAREMTGRAVEQETGSLDIALVELIVAVLLRCRAGQNIVVQEKLAAYSGLKPDLVLQVLGWAGANVHYVLAQVLAMPQDASDSSIVRRREEPPSDPVLQMLAEFSRRSAAVAMLELSGEFLTYFITIGYSQWFGEKQVAAFDLSSLYYLTIYKRALAMSSQPEARLIDYLRRIDALPAQLGNHGLELVQARAAKWLAELFNWSASDVQACATHVNPSKGLIVNMPQLDVLTRVCLLAKKTGQNAKTLLELGTLPADSEYALYAQVADRVRSSLTNVVEPPYEAGIRSVDVDVVVGWTTVPDPVRLIANKPDESAEFTVTVNNRLGAPRLNVNVHCASALGRFEPSMVTTDSTGTAKVKFFPDGRMGTVTPTYRLDLDDEMAAPNIEIGPDLGTLQVKPENSLPSPAGTVLVGTAVTCRAVVRDNYDNPISGASLIWTFEPLIMLETKTISDSRGYTEVTFTSTEAVKVKVKATAGNLSAATFRDVTFVETLPSRRRVSDTQTTTVTGDGYAQ